MDGSDVGAARAERVIEDLRASGRQGAGDGPTWRATYLDFLLEPQTPYPGAEIMSPLL